MRVKENRSYKKRKTQLPNKKCLIKVCYVQTSKEIKEFLPKYCLKTIHLDLCFLYGKKMNYFLCVVIQ